MYKINMTNRHKAKYVCFADLLGGQKVIVVFDTINKFNKWLNNSIGLCAYGLYDKSGKNIK